MKQILFLILFILLLFGKQFSLAQNSDKTISTKKKITRMGGAGGFTSFLLFWNTTEINNSFSYDNIPILPDQPVVLYGGQGYGYIMLIENFRVGGLGASGNSKSSLITGNVRRDLETAVSFSGVTFDFVFPVSERIDITTGILLGSGDIDVKLRRDNHGIKNWDNIINNWSSDIKINDYSYSLNGSFLTIQPSINIEYAYLRWLGFRLGASYNFMVSPDWKLDDKFEISSVPDKMNAKGIMLNFGIFLGTFLF